VIFQNNQRVFYK